MIGVSQFPNSVDQYFIVVPVFAMSTLVQADAKSLRRLRALDCNSHAGVYA